jgi:copper transport protein
VRRLALAGVVAGAALALPASAWAHAALLQTIPEASRTTNVAPTEVRLRYSEPVEPRFAIVSVTDAAGQQVTAGDPSAAPGSPQTLVTPLKRVPEGWFLVFWRVISADGHPVRGAFTFAVGPNPGPPPQFQVPSLSETATTGRLLAARWVVFLAVLSALGLFVLRTLIVRPVVRAVRGCSLRSLNVAFGVAVAVSLLAIPVYVLLATAQFTLRSFWDFGDILPAARASGFGRDFLDLELVMALFALAGGIALYVDRPEREQRSVSELLALPTALAAAAAALAYVVPRFSAVAFCSVLLLIGTGIGRALQELPTLASLWQTSYGQALLWKIGLLSAALLLAAVNLARTKPRLQGGDASAPLLLRRLVQGEIVFVAAALFAAGVLASLAPPSSALARVQDIAARVGPGPVSEVVKKGPYTVRVRVDPNRAAIPNAFTVELRQNGRPVRGAEVITKFDMLDMEMGEQSYRFRERRPGVFTRSAPALVMVGHWGLQFEITPPGARPFVVTLLDKAGG